MVFQVPLPIRGYGPRVWEQGLGNGFPDKTTQRIPREMVFQSADGSGTQPTPYLRVWWASSILAICILLQLIFLLLARISLGKNESVVVALVFGLILPAVIIVARISPQPGRTFRINGISPRWAFWVTGSALCFTITITSGVELLLQTGALPAEVQALLEEEERLLREVFSFDGVRDQITVGLATVVLAPVAEELLFRGLLQGSLERRLGNWPGLVLAGLVFGILHGRVRLLPVSLLGILMGYATMRTNSVISGMLAHSCNNVLALGLSFSVTPQALSPPWLTAGLGLGGMGLVVFLWRLRAGTTSALRIAKMSPRPSWHHDFPDQGANPSGYGGRPASEAAT